MLLHDLTKYLTNAPAGAVAEEFTNPDGTYNIKYVQHLLKNKGMTIVKLNQALQEADLPFIVHADNVTNEVSLELFKSDYEFGRHSNTKTWISHFANKYGKVLTKRALFEYLIPKHYKKLAYIESLKNEPAKT
jgi:hypothetical protein